MVIFDPMQPDASKYICEEPWKINHIQTHVYKYAFESFSDIPFKIELKGAVNDDTDNLLNANKLYRAYDLGFSTFVALLRFMPDAIPTKEYISSIVHILNYIGDYNRRGSNGIEDFKFIAVYIDDTIFYYCDAVRYFFEKAITTKNIELRAYLLDYMKNNIEPEKHMEMEL